MMFAPRKPSGQGFIAAINSEVAGKGHPPCRPRNVDGAAFQRLAQHPQVHDDRIPQPHRETTRHGVRARSRQTWIIATSHQRYRTGGVMGPTCRVPNISGLNCRPATVMSRFQFSLTIGGRMPGRRCASMLLPVPGGPVISIKRRPAAADQCPPACVALDVEQIGIG